MQTYLRKCRSLNVKIYSRTHGQNNQRSHSIYTIHIVHTRIIGCNIYYGFFFFTHQVLTTIVNMIWWNNKQYNDKWSTERMLLDIQTHNLEYQVETTTNHFFFSLFNHHVFLMISFVQQHQQSKVKKKKKNTTAIRIIMSIVHIVCWGHSFDLRCH